MRTLHLTGLALAISAGMALPLAGSAQAAMGGALPSTQILPVEQAQFFFLGHNFCWYDDGWQGPGWYWCDYAWNTGYGWGAAMAGTAGTEAHITVREACRSRPTASVRQSSMRHSFVRQSSNRRIRPRLLAALRPTTTSSARPKSKAALSPTALPPTALRRMARARVTGGGGKICPPGGKC